MVLDIALIPIHSFYIDSENGEGVYFLQAMKKIIK